MDDIFATSTSIRTLVHRDREISMGGVAQDAEAPGTALEITHLHEDDIFIRSYRKNLPATVIFTAIQFFRKQNLESTLQVKINATDRQIHSHVQHNESRC